MVKYSASVQRTVKTQKQIISKNVLTVDANRVAYTSHQKEGPVGARFNHRWTFHTKWLLRSLSAEEQMVSLQLPFSPSPHYRPLYTNTLHNPHPPTHPLSLFMDYLHSCFFGVGLSCVRACVWRLSWLRGITILQWVQTLLFHCFILHVPFFCLLLISIKSKSYSGVQQVCRL